MKDNSVSPKDAIADSSTVVDESVDGNVSESRRKALAKLAYSSPVIAGLLLSKTAAAQASRFTPPPPPG